MTLSKIRSLVGFAIKARKVAIGTDNIVTAKKCPYIVLYDVNLGENSLKKLLKCCEKAQHPTFAVTMEDIYPGHGCKALGICEAHIATAIIKEMEENL